MSTPLNPGVSPTPSYYEMSLTASVDVPKNLAGITPQGADLMFTAVNPHNTWKYQGTANNPLRSPLTSTREGVPTEISDNAAWLQNLSNLVQMLPKDVKDRLMYEAKLPKEERDESYGALDTLLGWAAASRTAVGGMHPPEDPTEMALTHIPQYSALPQVLQRNILATGKEVASSARDLLNEIGHQHPQFDHLSSLITGVATALSDLANVSGDKEQLSLLAGQLGDTVKQLCFAQGDSLQMLKPLLSSLHTIVSAASMKSASPSLLIGLSMASTGIKSSESAAGIVSQPMANLVDQLSAGLGKETLKNAPAGAKQLFPLLMNGLFISAAALPILVSGKNGDPLLSDLSIRLMVQSNSLQAISDGIAYASGASGKNAKATSSSLQLASLLISLRTASNGDPAKVSTMAEGMRDKLNSLVRETAEFTQQLASEGAEGAVHMWNLISQQAGNALDDRDFTAFGEVLERGADALNTQNASEKRLKEEEKDFKDFISSLQRYTGKQAQEELSIQTAISQGG